MSDTLELSILDSGSLRRAVAFARCGADTAISVLPCKQIAALSAFRDKLSLAAAGRGSRPTPAELSDFGQTLFKLVVNGDLFDLYSKLPPAHVRIQVLSNQPEIQALPWEYMKFPKFPAAPNNTRSVVRIVPTIGRAAPVPRPLQKKIRVLFAYADPIDQTAVGWEEVLASLRLDFKERLGDNAEVNVVEAATEAALTKEILAQPYDIFHFNGHGEVVTGANGRQIGNLLLVDFRTGKKSPLPAERLATLLNGQGLQLVVLSACNSATGTFGEGYAVVAQALVDLGVPAVVANQFAVTTSGAATFSSAFYAKLLSTGDVDLAVAAGRLTLHMQPTMPKDASIEWGIPTLYRHISGAKLFT